VPQRRSSTWVRELWPVDSSAESMRQLALRPRWGTRSDEFLEHSGDPRAVFLIGGKAWMLLGSKCSHHSTADHSSFAKMETALPRARSRSRAELCRDHLSSEMASLPYTSQPSHGRLSASLRRVRGNAYPHAGCRVCRIRRCPAAEPDTPLAHLNTLRRCRPRTPDGPKQNTCSTCSKVILNDLPALGAVGPDLSELPYMKR
jgi:hypothetical protein